jgi:alkanesulfonate monooxygenase SsuD/methylene tetrahydromethanopterin reductase-like flavin-dependent oxidoreductase (luciferase family)
MEFGYGLLTAQCPPGSDTSHEQVYEETLDVAALAEDVGFDCVWTSEHHFFDDGYSPSVFPLSAAIARETDEIDVGTGIALAPLHHPVRLAEDAATVDLLSGGRFRLGLANGYIDREFEVFDSPKRQRAGRVEDAIEICRGAWEEGPLSHDGHLHTVDELNVTPKPAREGGPPIWLGGTSEPAVERAAERADGHIGIVYYDSDFSYRSSFEQFADNVDRLADARGDLDGFTTALMQYTHVGRDADDAWDALFPAMVYSRRAYAEQTPERDDGRWRLDAIDDERERQLRAGSLVGDPDDVVARLKEYEAAVPGELHVIARMWHPTMDYDELAEAAELFGEEVIPAFD